MSAESPRWGSDVRRAEDETSSRAVLRFSDAALDLRYVEHSPPNDEVLDQ